MATGDDWGEMEREFDRADEIALDADDLAWIFLALAVASAGLTALAFWG